MLQLESRPAPPSLAQGNHSLRLSYVNVQRKMDLFHFSRWAELELRREFGLNMSCLFGLFLSGKYCLKGKEWQIRVVLQVISARLTFR